MIRKMIDKEVGTSQCNVIELYEERCVYNLYNEMKVAGSDEASGGFTDQSPRRVTLAEEVLRVAPQIEASEDVPRVDLRAELSAHSVEQFEMDDTGSESHAAEDDPHASLAN